MTVTVSDVIDMDRGLIGPVRPGSSLGDANTLMVENRVGALVVVDQNDLLVGIISERDVTRGLQEFGLDVLDKLVGDVMTSNVISCNPFTDIRDATEMMIQNGIRHLPIQDEGKPQTLLSIRDIVAVRLGTLESDNELLRAQLEEMARA
ncbi:MAG: CBS domain-containing protein [Alphaproteobacteria bacterium]|jgi:CBS domain-containing protein